MELTRFSFRILLPWSSDPYPLEGKAIFSNSEDHHPFLFSFSVCSVFVSPVSLVKTRKEITPVKWRGGLMVSTMFSGSSVSGSNPGRDCGVEFLGKILYSQSASLHPGA